MIGGTCHAKQPQTLDINGYHHEPLTAYLTSIPYLFTYDPVPANALPICPCAAGQHAGSDAGGRSDSQCNKQQHAYGAVSAARCGRNVGFGYVEGEGA